MVTNGILNLAALCRYFIKLNMILIEFSNYFTKVCSISIFSCNSYLFPTIFYNEDFLLRFLILVYGVTIKYKVTSNELIQISQNLTNFFLKLNLVKFQHFKLCILEKLFTHNLLYQHLEILVFGIFF